MPTPEDPYQAEPDDHVVSEPLEDADGNIYQVGQEPVGAERVAGGGEFPDPDAPAQFPAPGAVDQED